MPMRHRSTLPQPCILVHGTFAPNADWIEPDSRFVEGLSKELGRPLFGIPWHWSGRNSHAARLHAGHRTAAWLRARHKRYPAERPVIIAHSHGGNVVGYALRELKDQSWIAGVIMLATPHIHIDKRNVRNIVLPLRVLVTFATMLFLPLAVVVPLVLFGGIDEPGVTLAALVLGVVCAGRVFHWVGHVGAGLREWAKNRSQELKVPEPRVPTLSLSIHGDEAAGLLKGLRVLYEPLHWFWQRLAARGSQLLLILFLVGMVVVFLGILLEVIVKQEGPFLEFFWIDVAGPIIMWTLVILVPSFGLLMVLPRVVRDHPLGFGWESLRTALVIDVAVRHPDWAPRLFHAEMIPVSKLRQDTGLSRMRQLLSRTLRHSEVYSDPVALKCIAKWMSENAPPERRNAKSSRS